MDPSQRLKELFSRYLQRDIQPAEVEELVLLLGQADAEEALSGPMRHLWEELMAKPAEYPLDWDRMYRQVSQVEEDLSALKRRRGGIFSRGGGILRRPDWNVIRWRAVAAAFLLLAATAAYWSVTIRRSPAGGGVAGPSGGQPAGVAVRTGSRTEAGGHGQTAENKKVIHLPDGSMVILNKYSTLDYTAFGPSGTREVTLNGEAYFDIVHRPGQSFLVHTGKIVTRVLGTAFNIKAYAAESSIEVTVDHGKVQVLKGNANMGMLSDRQQIRFDRGTESYRSQKVNVKPVIAWKPVEISFDDITMEEATRQIGQRFNVAFSFVNPALKDCRVTATFYMEDDLDQIMTVICGVNQSNFVIKGDKIAIDGKGCN
jgi:ferric-dicitrate binding protein FerR (iron transport regulator)